MCNNAIQIDINELGSGANGIPNNIIGKLKSDIIAYNESRHAVYDSISPYILNFPPLLLILCSAHPTTI